MFRWENVKIRLWRFRFICAYFWKIKLFYQSNGTFSVFTQSHLNTRGVGEHTKVMQTFDCVSGLRNCLEFSQSLSCLEEISERYGKSALLLKYGKRKKSVWAGNQTNLLQVDESIFQLGVKSVLGLLSVAGLLSGARKRFFGLLQFLCQLASNERVNKNVKINTTWPKFGSPTLRRQRFSRTTKRQG